MTKKLKSLLVTLASTTVVSCAGTPVSTYEKQGPPFDFENFFNGQLEAVGFFQDRFGKVVKQIHCKMDAKWTGDTVTVEEHFTYSDGTSEDRVWKFKKEKDGLFIGTAADVVGDAAGQTAGFAFNMNYTLRLKVSNKTLDVKMDDWMYRANEKTVINKTKMSKWGVHLGDVTLAIIKK